MIRPLLIVARLSCFDCKFDASQKLAGCHVQRAAIVTKGAVRYGGAG